MKVRLAASIAVLEEVGLHQNRCRRHGNILLPGPISGEQDRVYIRLAGLVQRLGVLRHCWDCSPGADKNAYADPHKSSEGRRYFVLPQLVREGSFLLPHGY